MTRFRIAQLHNLPIYRIEYYREPSRWRRGKWKPYLTTHLDYSGEYLCHECAEFSTYSQAQEALTELIKQIQERETRQAGFWRAVGEEKTV